MARIYTCDTCHGTHPRTFKQRVVGGVTEMYQVWKCNGVRREKIYASFGGSKEVTLNIL